MPQQSVRFPGPTHGTWNRSSRRAGSELAAILDHGLPVLPGSDVPTAARQLRRLSGAQAAAVWRHPTWGELVSWIGRQAPEADPVAPAVAAITHARAPAGRLSAYVLATARASAVIQRPCWQVPLSDAEAERLPAPPLATRSADDSLWREARVLLESAGMRLSVRAQETVSMSIDIAVDWWDQFAERTGLTGEALVHASRYSRSLDERRRLQSLFDGSQARPLVTLLLGGGQAGRRVREASGVEAGLLYWALAVRHADRSAVPPPVPPPEVTASWAAMLALLDDGGRRCGADIGVPSGGRGSKGCCGRRGAVRALSGDVRRAGA